MRKRQEWWLATVMLVSVAVIGGMLFAGCEYFKPAPQEPPPPPPGNQDDDDGDQDEPQGKYPDITGKWDVELRTNGTKWVDIAMTLTMDEDDIGGNWNITGGGPPIGGDVEGDIDEDGDVDLDLKIGGTTALGLKGEANDDGDEMDGKWTGGPASSDKKWDAEKD